MPPQAGDGAAGVEAGFQSLFNGQDLRGWRVDRGDPTIWHVEDGVLVAAADGDWRKQNFLLSDRDFSNFVLRFEFQIPKNADSGIALLASPGEHHLEVNLRNFEEPPGLHAQTAATALVDEWKWQGLPAPGPTGRIGARPRLERGKNRVTRWILAGLGQWTAGAEYGSAQLAARPNALPALKRGAGRIGFQSHTGTVRFRNILIESLDSPAKALPPKVGEPDDSGGFRTIFNGQDLSGWQVEGGDPTTWDVEDGSIVGSGWDYRTRSHLVTDREYSDFVLRLEFTLAPGGSSGIGIRGAGGSNAP